MHYWILISNSISLILIIWVSGLRNSKVHTDLKSSSPKLINQNTNKSSKNEGESPQVSKRTKHCNKERKC